MTALISVIIPFYNRSSTLARAIHSVLLQTYDHFEIICVDDGSTDDSVNIIDSFADERIILVQHPHNKGASAARNTGVNHAQGEYIAFLDSDDEWRTDKLRLQLVELDICHADIAFTDFDLVKNSHHTVAQIPFQPTQTDWGRYFLTGCYVSPGATLMMKRSLWFELGGLDETLARLEDWDFLLRAAFAHARFCCVGQSLAVVHLGKGWPKPDIIAQACKNIINKNETMALKYFGYSGLHTLKSSAILEYAAAQFRNNRHLIGAFYLLVLMIYAPKRFLIWMKR